MSLSFSESDSSTSEDESVLPGAKDALPPVLAPEIQRALEQNPFATESSYFTRPNRFFGAASTWRSWTAQDRAVADALHQVRSRDLSAHLYNVYALKRKTKANAEPPENQSEGELKEKLADEVKVGHQDQKLFLPPKVWTAWPLPPEQVPRKDRECQREPSNFHRKSDNRASAGLEEALIACMLKTAKERWNERLWQKGTSSTDPIRPNRDWKAEKEATERWNSSHSTTSRYFDQDRTDSNGDAVASQQSTLLQSAQDSVDGNTDHVDTDSTSSSSQAAQDPETPITFSSQAFVTASSPNSKPLVDKNLKDDKKDKDRPTFTTDNERAHKLLTPSARHILSKLDDLLIGLHKARKIYATGRHSKDSRSSSMVPSQQSASNDSASPTKDVQIENARGRKRKRASSIPDNDETTGCSKSRSRSRRDRLTAGGLGLRDWSDVLGLAALTGWDPAVVGRVSERCAKLFNENMMFRTFHEGNAKADEPSHFSEEFAIIDDIPVPDSEGDRGEQKEMSLVRISGPCTRCRKRKKRCNAPAYSSIHAAMANLPITLPCYNCETADLSEKCSEITCKLITPHVSVDTGLPLNCPFPSCDRHRIPFQKRYNLERHIEDVHHSRGEQLSSPERNLSRSMLAEISEVDADAQDTRTCPVKSCSRIFKRATRLYDHIRAMHPEINVEQFKKLKTWRRRRSRGSTSRSRSLSKRRDDQEMLESRGKKSGEYTAEGDGDGNALVSQESDDAEAESGQQNPASEHMAFSQEQNMHRFENYSDAEADQISEEESRADSDND